MDKLLVFFWSLFFVSAVTAQTINVSGKITNASGQAVSGATVELVNQGLKDTTEADGMYAFDQPLDVMRPGAMPENMTMIGGMLQIQLSVPAPIEVKVFDLQGNLLKKNRAPDAAAGTHTLNLEEGTSSSGMMLIQASIGDETRTFRYLPLGLSEASGRSVTETTPLAAPLAKVAAEVDTLKVTAAGYAVTTVVLSSYDTTVNLALEPSGDSDRWGGPGNPPLLSSGCGNPQGITSGFKTINNEGQNREYVIDIPTGYDPDKPYRFFYVSHWASGNAQSMANNNYYRIKDQANAADEPAIFVAASGIGGFWGEEDHPLFDNILAHVEENLCIDRSRVFLIGYSFGGMISYSLSRNHQDKIRGVVGIAPANWNIWMPETTNEPIAWLQIHGLRDETCLWVNNESNRTGGKYIVLEKAMDNGCDIPGDDDFPVWQSGPHFCYEFEGCDAGYPVKICTNNERHSGAERYTDSGENSSWVPPTAWEFFTRF